MQSLSHLTVRLNHYQHGARGPYNRFDTCENLGEQPKTEKSKEYIFLLVIRDKLSFIKEKGIQENEKAQGREEQNPLSMCSIKNSLYLEHTKDITMYQSNSLL